MIVYIQGISIIWSKLVFGKVIVDVALILKDN